MKKYIQKKWPLAKTGLNQSYDNIHQEKEQVEFDLKNHRGKEVDIDAMFFSGTEEPVRVLGDELFE